MNQVVTHEAVERAQQAAAEMGDKAAGAVRAARETAGDWTQKAQEHLRPITDAASSYIEQGRQKAEAIGHTVTDQVQERPVSALLAAAGIGFLLGVLLVRR